MASGAFSQTARVAPNHESRQGLSERDRERSRFFTETRLAPLARFLLTWLAAFLMIVGLFSAFGGQLKAMSPQLRALTVSGIFVVAMNFLIMPAISYSVSHFLARERPRKRTARK